MAEMNDMIRDQAIAWAMRVREADFSDWDGFTRWLEADDLHNIAYEQVLMAEDHYAELIEASEEPFVLPEHQDNISVLRHPANDEYSAPPAGMTRRQMTSVPLPASMRIADGAGSWIPKA